MGAPLSILAQNSNSVMREHRRAQETGNIKDGGEGGAGIAIIWEIRLFMMLYPQR